MLRPALLADAGTLSDPYTGETIGFVHGAGTSADVQIDHLLAVKGSENGSKADSLPGVYPVVSDRHDAGQRVVWDDLPADTALQCWYVTKLVPVFVAYELGVTPADRAAMSAVLRTC